MTAEYQHIPVMLNECRELLKLKPGETYCDCTLGGAGHAAAIAEDLQGEGTIIGIDQDTMALEAAGERIASMHPDLEFLPLYGNFSELDELLVKADIVGVDAILFDLGVSSPQLDIPQRGFSYAREAPLDMRMDPGKQTLNAAEIINTKNAADLTRIFREYGEERWATRIAKFVVEARRSGPIESTTELVEIIKAAIPAAARSGGGNPAKRVFQALRIAVNDEMGALKEGLEAALRWLNPKGRIVVISYHSLEDRIVKEAFSEAAKSCICPPEVPICTCEHELIITKYSKKPLRASEEETELNPRAKSARLRVAIKK